MNRLVVRYRMGLWFIYYRVWVDTADPDREVILTAGYRPSLPQAMDEAYVYAQAIS